MNNLSTKYKHRFASKHQKVLKEIQDEEKAEEERRKSQLLLMRKDASQSSHKLQELEEKLTHVENATTSLKPPLADLSNFLDVNMCHEPFLQINGLAKLIKLLDREEKKNREGPKNNFSNQIELLRLIRSLALRTVGNFSVSYSEAVQNVPTYLASVMRNFHPVNIAITAFVL